MARRLALTLLSETLAVCRLAPEAPLPPWATVEGFLSVTRTAEELSVVTAESQVPPHVECERSLRALKAEGSFDFSQVGILVAILNPLAEAGISIFAVSTYDTDYVLVREPELAPALAVLRAAGHSIRE